ncbi:MAG: hypothetical protein FGM57_02775 [Candidatus Taylorbacteria bacterium]|nr:hypothetical protein [Candidatus Taylorbacteria bacterium]
MCKEYITYINDNPNRYWFKRKIYGWGWTPAAWQGWTTTIIYLAFIIFLVYLQEEVILGNPDSGSNLLVFGLPFALSTILFVFIAYKKGEKPKWQWGISKKDDK